MFCQQFSYFHLDKCSLAKQNAEIASCLSCLNIETNKKNRLFNKISSAKVSFHSIYFRLKKKMKKIDHIIANCFLWTVWTVQSWGSSWGQMDESFTGCESRLWCTVGKYFISRSIHFPVRVSAGKEGGLRTENAVLWFFFKFNCQNGCLFLSVWWIVFC